MGTDLGRAIRKAFLVPGPVLGGDYASIERRIAASLEDRARRANPSDTPPCVELHHAGGVTLRHPSK
jgi:hypothetical protein